MSDREPKRCEYPFSACDAAQEVQRLRARVAELEAALADERKHADELFSAACWVAPCENECGHRECDAYRSHRARRAKEDASE